VADRKAIENTFTQVDEVQRLWADLSGELICFKHLDGKPFYVSNSVERILGYTPEEFLAQEAARLSPASGEISSINASAGEFAQPPVQQEFVAKNGQRVVLELRDHVIRHEGEAVALMCLARDVTEQQRIIEELRWSNQELTIIHHTQKRLLGVTDRRELLAIALDSVLSAAPYDVGALFEFDLEAMKATRLDAKGPAKGRAEAIASFPLTTQIKDGTIGPDLQTTALLLPPGHSWLSALSGLGLQVSGVLLICHGKPEALAVLASIEPFKRDTFRLFQLIGNLVAHAIDNSYLHSVIENLTIIDTDTGLYNRSYIERYLAHEERVIQRFARSATIVRIGLPTYRNLLETREQERADHVVSEAARLVKANIRASDLLGRYKEDEFLLYLPETSETGALAMLGRCQQLLEHHNRRRNAEQPEIVVTFGVASLANTERTLQDLIDEAGEKLAERKA